MVQEKELGVGTLHSFKRAGRERLQPLSREHRIFERFVVSLHTSKLQRCISGFDLVCATIRNGMSASLARLRLAPLVAWPRSPITRKRTSTKILTIYNHSVTSENGHANSPAAPSALALQLTQEPRMTPR